MTYNHVTLIGNLTKDPETKKVGNKSKTDFTVAVERYCKPGEKPEIDHFNIVAWGNLADICHEFLRANSKVLVDGRIQIRTMNTDGERKWITEVIAENIKFLKKAENDEEKKNDN